jgi:HEAT repeat protein
MAHSPEPDTAEVVLAGASGDVEVLDRASRSADPVLRILSLGSRHRCGLLTVEALQAACTDLDRDVRCRAVELAIGTDLELVSMLEDPDDLVVETVAWVLGEREDDRATTVAALVAVGMDHPVPICREAAIASLGAIGHPDGLPAIFAGLTDKPPVRRRSVLALAPFDGPEVTEALERALTDRDRQVRQAAEDLL